MQREARDAVATFLNEAKREAKRRPVEIEAAFGLSSGVGRQHLCVDYRHFYRFFSAISEIDDVRYSDATFTTDKIYPDSTRIRTNATGQSIAIKKTSLRKPLIVRLPRLWPHACLKLRASREQRLPKMPAGKPLFVRSKTRISFWLTRLAAFWRVDCTVVEQGDISMFEIEVELDHAAIKAAGSATTEEIVRQFAAVVDMVIVCMNKQ